MDFSSSSSGRKHDVYISVQNDDPCKYVTDMISRSLTIRGVPTFVDENQLRSKTQGSGSVQMGRELKDVIAMSRITIILFSRSYVCSSWCLEELAVIMDCRSKWGLIVLPIFYNVDPSDVRKQRGYAATAVSKQRKGGCWYRRWKRALGHAANFCGWDHSANDRIESMLVGKVVEEIVNKRTPTNLHISIYPIRYDILDEYLNLFTRVGRDYVLIVGICGPSGMGKTSIAEAIYEQIFYTFEGSSFLENVGQNSRKPNGLVQLQEKLLSDILSERNVKVRDVNQGVDMIKEKLGYKRVLVILDDVDDFDQLYALVGSRSRFGLGSKIIVTTRKVHLLNVLEVDQVFMAQGLPLPPNIQAIWEKYQQSRREIAGLKEYIQAFYNLTDQKVRYLEDCLRRERRKNAIQAQVISEMKLLESRGSASITRTTKDDAMHIED